MTNPIGAGAASVSEAKAGLSYLDEVAETIRDDAIALARRKLGATRGGSDLNKLLRDPLFLDYFKYGLALGVVNVLAASDGNVHTAYLHEPAMDSVKDAGEDRQDVTLHLILQLIMTPRVSLERLIDTLDGALAASLRELPSPRLEQRESVLDISLVADEEIRYGMSRAGLVVGLFASPLRIWQRE